ncbi:MAG: bifunctional diguanylate cyclase/phosphodiesterase [Lachnospiraceae bacterium]|nr:bifunctional diguanylate cyclase/phosphodiesterase [Lachnospiraceae bacterium]
MYKINKRYDSVFLIIIFALSAVLVSSTVLINRFQIALPLGNSVIRSDSLCGIVQSCIFLLTIFAVLVNYNYGLVGAMLVFGFQIGIGMVNGIRMRATGSIPGVFNAAVSIFVLVLISRQLAKRERESNTDLVTGLTNRRAFEQMLAWKTAKHQSGHVVYFILNNFRAINENLGHRYGDLVLKEVADRISESIGDRGIVCKNDGAEYLLLLTDKGNPIEAIEKIMKAVGEKLVVTKDGINVNYFLTCSAGVASFPKDSNDASTLLKHADVAMVDARHRGAGEISFYDSKLANGIAHQQEVERKIKECLENNYFYLVYQPQYKLEEKALRGFETLIRMDRPDGENISPGEFIGVAERTELIHQIDNYVLRRAMWEFGSIIRNADNDIVLSINVSAKGMGRAGFAETVKSIINETDFPANHLEIELTEYSFSESAEHTVENIRVLKDIGVKIALDDFGTGYTSLIQLLRLPIDLLKIDKSLIDDIETSQQNQDFIDSVIYMGHIMDCEVISEGVETDEQLAVLKEHKCDFVQGYVWGKPLSYDTAVSMI